ncbi:SDR family NAD(P)-dependent oxidoreductase [Nocardia sp. IFM 10818]
MTDKALTGKTVVVTGASSGIGAEAAAKFAALGAKVAVVGRTPDRTTAVAERIGADHYLADFTRFDDVRALAHNLLDRYPRIDILANNAGGAWAERLITPDGNETTFQVNHLSPFLLTTLLLDRLVESRARVLNTASTTYRFAKLDLDTVNARTGPYSQFAAYGQAKLATILYTRELARRTAGRGLTTAAFHPGVVATHVYDNVPFGFGRLVRSPLGRPFFIKPDKGAEPLLQLATTADPIDGKYFHRLKLEEPRNSQALDNDLAERLWVLSESLTGAKAVL